MLLVCIKYFVRELLCDVSTKYDNQSSDMRHV